MPSFLVNETLPVPQRNTLLVLPGITQVVSVCFHEEQYKDKSVAVACESNDRTSSVYVFDTPRPGKDETRQESKDRIAAQCIGKNLVKQLVHAEIYQVVIALEDQTTVATFTAKHFCDMAPNTFVYLSNDAEEID